MAESAQIDKVGNWHEQLVTFLIANPRMKRSDVARHFQVTPAWLSTVIHSDVFQAKLAERQDECFSSATADIKARLESIAHGSLEKLEEKIETTEEVSEIREIAKLALTNLGYNNGPNGKAPGPGLVQNNFYSVSPELLASARERILTQHGTTIDGEANHLAAPAQIQAGDGGTMGTALENRPALRAPEQTPGEAPGR